MLTLKIISYSKCSTDQCLSNNFLEMFSNYENTDNFWKILDPLYSAVVLKKTKQKQNTKTT